MNAYSPKLVALTLQILSIIFGIVCSITRITDHRHHWWDVACGAILGALTAIFAVSEKTFILDNSYRKNYAKIFLFLGEVVL